METEDTSSVNNNIEPRLFEKVTLNFYIPMFFYRITACISSSASCFLSYICNLKSDPEISDIRMFLISIHVLKYIKYLFAFQLTFFLFFFRISIPGYYEQQFFDAEDRIYNNLDRLVDYYNGSIRQDKATESWMKSVMKILNDMQLLNDNAYEGFPILFDLLIDVI